ncbi:PLDc N-terminal domain-containing protein [Phaeovibrio sulfidiphilus]|uniref:PLDc N-terminal domain-containing protein n=1 Tax=Phaeovibrio sulfidiphilus TaxID=1220600 RepID=A0A8J6YNR8_9PROT|nr:PLDc N-terminal domain-containing protein [Phaeovibrio sulfidiphilus]MBE1236337.1 PLDc N-terminal domain-containing protein [Phaeovibrio sulfidiphilus]
MTGFLAFLLLVGLFAWAVTNVLVNRTTSRFRKALWTLLLFFVPGVGFAVWFFVGPRASI